MSSRKGRREGKESAGGLVSVGDMLPGLEVLAEQKPLLPKKPKLVLSDNKSTAQGRHHYTRLQQVTELVRLGEGGSQDMGFMARMLTLCSLPRIPLTKRKRGTCLRLDNPAESPTLL
jgi:phage tail protein X